MSYSRVARVAEAENTEEEGGREGRDRAGRASWAAGRTSVLTLKGVGAMECYVQRDLL